MYILCVHIAYRYLYIYISVYIYRYIHTHTEIYTDIHIHTYTCICICKYISIYNDTGTCGGCGGNVEHAYRPADVRDARLARGQCVGRERHRGREGVCCDVLCCAVCLCVCVCMHACIPRKLVQVRNEYMEAKSKAMGLPSNMQYFSATQLAAMDTNNDGMRAGHMYLLCSLLPALCTVPGKACLDSHISASAPACVRVSRLRFRGGAAGLACAERRRPGLSPNHS